MAGRHDGDRLRCRCSFHLVTFACGHLLCPRCDRGEDGRNGRPDCRHTFDDDDDRHRRTPQKRAWSSSSNDSTEGVMCWRHGFPLDVYCCTDKRILCAVCAEAEHGGHSIGCVREERRRVQVHKKKNNKFLDGWMVPSIHDLLPIPLQRRRGALEPIPAYLRALDDFEPRVFPWFKVCV